MATKKTERDNAYLRAKRMREDNYYYMEFIKESRGNLGMTPDELLSARYNAVAPVARIDFLGCNGMVGESVEYTSAEKFRETLEEETFYGAPMIVTIYTDSHGKTIPYGYIYELDPPPKKLNLEAY